MRIARNGPVHLLAITAASIYAASGDIHNVRFILRGATRQSPRTDELWLYWIEIEILNDYLEDALAVGK